EKGHLGNTVLAIAQERRRHLAPKLGQELREADPFLAQLPLERPRADSQAAGDALQGGRSLAQLGPERAAHTLAERALRADARELLVGEGLEIADQGLVRDRDPSRQILAPQEKRRGQRAELQWRAEESLVLLDVGGLSIRQLDEERRDPPRHPLPARPQERHHASV